MIYKRKGASLQFISFVLFHGKALYSFLLSRYYICLSYLFRCRCNCCWRRRSRHFNSFRRSSVHRSSFPTLFFFSRCICSGRDMFIRFSMNLPVVLIAKGSILSFLFVFQSLCCSRLSVQKRILNLYSFLFPDCEVYPRHRYKSEDTEKIRCCVSR